MSQLIDAATLVQYNANVRGNNVGDCVCRSISFAFDLSYSKTGKLLNKKMRQLHRDHWNVTAVFESVIHELGGSAQINLYKENESYLTVEEFADSNSNGCFLVLCGKSSSDTKSSHIVCIIDGKIYDSWDSRNQYAKKYYDCSNDRHVNDENLEDIIFDLVDIAEDLLITELNKYAEKWIPQGDLENGVNVFWRFTQISPHYEGFGIQFNCRFKYVFSFRDASDEKILSFRVVCTLKPGMNENEANSFIKKTIKQRAYDRMYAIRESYKDDLAEFEAIHIEGVESGNSRLYTSAAEDRFIKQLPGRIRPYISSIRIQNPGQYSDSYRISISRLPNDPNSDPKFQIESYESSGAKKMIDRYVKTFERPWIDYDPQVEGYT